MDASYEDIAPVAPPVQRTLAPPAAGRLVGNRMALAGALLALAEFVGIVASQVHTLPALPGASDASLMTTYAGQAGALGFLVGWFSLTSPGRVLFVLGVRQALVRSGNRSALLDYAVVLMGVTAALELAAYALCAGAAAAADRGEVAVVAALDRAAHYLQVGLYGPGGLAGLLLAFALWRAPAVPRVLVGLVALVAGVDFLNGTLLSAPGQATLQDSLTAVNLLGFAVNLWLGVLIFRRRPARESTV